LSRHLEEKVRSWETLRLILFSEKEKNGRGPDCMYMREDRGENSIEFEEYLKLVVFVVVFRKFT
jgi:hypothetical protein